MNTSSLWNELSSAPRDVVAGKLFGLLQQAAIQLSSGDTENADVLELVPRMTDLLDRRSDLSELRDPLNSLARATGLWNYIDKSTAEPEDLILAESVTVPELDGITLHREQVAALNTLLSGRNLVLSAPTSFGKSLLIDALLATGRYNRVAIVLPTIALLDEFRRRLKRRLEDRFQLVMHPSDKPGDKPVIFLGTQERLLTRTDLGSLDLAVVDEFYKLDPERKDDRSITLNAAAYKLLNRSRQFFFLGPNIDDVRVEGDGRWKFEFLRTRFSTVAVDTFDLRNATDKESRLFDELLEESHWPALVFVSSPDKANKLAASASKQMAISDDGSEFAKWLRDNVGEGWTLATAVEFGFAVHHGRIPRAIASHMIRLFNRGSLPVMFCTSTLIEGVNTAAKTVLIYDKSINRSSFDFFTFSNIRGRAGRLGQHHIGKVYLFNDPPTETSTEVAPMLFGDIDEAPDDFVVHLEANKTSGTLDERISLLKSEMQLTAEELKSASSIGIENAIALKNLIASSNLSSLVWNGYPKYPQLAAVCEIACKVKKPTDFGALTHRQLAYLINRLSFAPTMREFLVEYDSKYDGDPVTHDNIFKFLRSCEYGLPQVLAVMEIFVSKRSPLADYSVFVHALSRWFRPEILKNFDEEGIPIQISERFYKAGDERVHLVRKLQSQIALPTAVSAFERDWLSDALDMST